MGNAFITNRTIETIINNSLTLRTGNVNSTYSGNTYTITFATSARIQMIYFVISNRRLTSNGDAQFNGYDIFYCKSTTVSDVNMCFISSFYCQYYNYENHFEWYTYHPSALTITDSLFSLEGRINPNTTYNFWYAC